MNGWEYLAGSPFAAVVLVLAVGWALAGLVRAWRAGVDARAMRAHAAALDAHRAELAALREQLAPLTRAGP